MNRAGGLFFLFPGLLTLESQDRAHKARAKETPRQLLGGLYFSLSRPIAAAHQRSPFWNLSPRS